MGKQLSKYVGTSLYVNTCLWPDVAVIPRCYGVVTYNRHFTMQKIVYNSISQPISSSV